MDLSALKTELLAGHPSTGAYSLDAQGAADQINALNVTRIRASMTGSELWAATAPTEFNALTDTQKSHWAALCAIDRHNPESGGLVQQATVALFGSGSGTVTTLSADRDETVSRATELGFGRVRAYDIEKARAL